MRAFDGVDSGGFWFLDFFMMMVVEGLMFLVFG